MKRADQIVVGDILDRNGCRCFVEHVDTRARHPHSMFKHMTFVAITHSNDLNRDSKQATIYFAHDAMVPTL